MPSTFHAVTLGLAVILTTACGDAPQAVSTYTRAASGPLALDVPGTSAADLANGGGGNAHGSQDPNAELMGRIDGAAVRAAVEGILNDTWEAVPRKVHRVLRPNEHLGDWAEWEAWQTYCDAQGFELVEWEPAAALTSGHAARTPRGQAVWAAHRAKRPDVVSHLTALAVLAKHGGYLVGPGVLPPRDQEGFMDLEALMGHPGLTLAINPFGRNVGGPSVYVTTALMAASPHHPWLEAVSAGAAGNVTNLLAGPYPHLQARYFAGSAYLSRNLAGSFHALPFALLQQIHMFPQGAPPTPPAAGGQRD